MWGKEKNVHNRGEWHLWLIARHTQLIIIERHPNITLKHLKSHHPYLRKFVGMEQLNREPVTFLQVLNLGIWF